MLTFEASPTGQAFLDSKAFIKTIMGPVGGGKSTVCLFALLDLAVNQTPFQSSPDGPAVRRTKFFIVRNTMQQLMGTVKPLIDYWFVERTGGAMGAWRLTEKVFEMKFLLPDGTMVHSEFCFLPADTPDDVRRLLSLEGSAAWLEEGREIVEEIFEGIQARIMRFPNREAGGIRYPCVLMSTNPPPMGTYLQELMADPPANMECFVQPSALLDDGSINPEADNLKHLDPGYYPTLMEGKTQDWIDVFLKNKFGPGGFGMPVFATTFKREFHVSPDPLRAIPSANHPIIIGADNGLEGAAVIMQMDARGRVNVLGEAFVPYGESMGYETFLDRILTPYLQAHFPSHPSGFLFNVDPACFQRSQANEVTVAQVIAARGYRVNRAPTGNSPERCIAAVEGLLVRAIDGKAGLLIDPGCTHLIKALDWGYRNKKQANGQVTAVPEKNHYSHIADALQYGSLHFNLVVNAAAGAFNVRKKEVKAPPRPYVYA
jgi:hypothetical protein